MIKLLKYLFALFYPELCLNCKKILVEGEKFVCLDCFCDLPTTDYHLYKANNARILLSGYSQLNEVTAYLYFEKEGVTQKLVHALKYYGNKSLAVYLGNIAATELKNAGYFASIDTIIPVPLHPKRERKRGYNQSACIAQGMAAVYGCSVETEAVRRVVNTKTQTRKNAYDRRLNVENIFMATAIEALSGKHVLLIDDVMTTGSTISACVDALVAVPNITISIFALSIAGQR
ncbi:MAG: ComF family protein [Tannerella sp.]|jgi:ComF family protein|nr:ComF family protein [Tannerella sp.]